MSFPQWKGLWDWSMKYADGSEPSSFRPEDVDPEKMKWLDAALKHYMVDFSARMMEIKTALQRDAAVAAAAAPDGAAAGAGGRGSDQAAGADLAEREALLDELMDIVSSIDYARDLHKIGGLPVLLELLASPQPSLQWRAAEVVATCVANNPPVQQWFLEGGVLPRLMALAAPSEPDGTVRTKALLALSGLVRHFGPGLQAFLDAGGLALLVGSLGASDRRITRKAMTLLSYLLSQRRADCVAAVRDGALLLLVSELGTGAAPTAASAAADASSAKEDVEVATQEDSDIRQAALGALLQLASYPATWAMVRDAPGLRSRLAELEAAHAALPEDEREAQAEELGLLTQLSGLLAAAAPPPAGPDDQEHVSVEAFEAAGRGTTFEVNAPAAAAAAASLVAGGKGVGGGDAGAGTGDQGGAAAPAVTQGAGEGAGTAAASTAAPLLLGAP